MSPQIKREREAPLGKGTSKKLADLVERQCFVTRETRAKRNMLRFVLSPDGVVTPDIRGKLPGRGAWLAARREVVEEAISKRLFARAFKTNCDIPEGLGVLIEQSLLFQCQNIIGMAKKSGHTVTGYDMVRSNLQVKRPGALIQASDTRPDGREKVFRLAQAIHEDVRRYGALNAEELGAPFGRMEVKHLILKTGPFTKKWVIAYDKLIGFRTAPEVEWQSQENEG